MVGLEREITVCGGHSRKYRSRDSLIVYSLCTTCQVWTLRKPVSHFYRRDRAYNIP